MKEIVQRILRRWGVELRRTNAADEAFAAQQRHVTRNDPVIFDVGAHHGRIAQHYRALFPNATLHCFEPFPESFMQLQARLTNDRRAHLHALAVSDRAGSASLYANVVSDTNSLLPFDPQAKQFWGAGNTETVRQVSVEAVTLDAFCAAQNIKTVDILKLDIQGHEFAALSGARSLLTAQRIGLIYFELIFAPNYLGQRPPRDYLNLLEECGYELVDFYNPIRRQHRLIQADVLFVPRS